MYAEVIIELGPPHNQTINLGTFEHDALQRLAQEIEHDLDGMQDTANNLTPNAPALPPQRSGGRQEQVVGNSGGDKCD